MFVVDNPVAILFEHSRHFKLIVTSLQPIFVLTTREIKKSAAQSCTVNASSHSGSALIAIRANVCLPWVPLCAQNSRCDAMRTHKTCRVWHITLIGRCAGSYGRHACRACYTKHTQPVRQSLRFRAKSSRIASHRIRLADHNSIIWYGISSPAPNTEWRRCNDDVFQRI